jgi:hypothetical protein
VAGAEGLIEHLIEPTGFIIVNDGVHSNGTINDFSDALCTLIRLTCINNSEPKVVPQRAKQSSECGVWYDDFTAFVRRQQNVASILIAGYMNDVWSEGT